MGRRAANTVLFLIVVFVVFAALLIYFSSQPGAGGTVQTAATTGTVSHVGPPTLYPNSALTPGDALPGVTAAQVCRAGYATSVRNVSSAEKAEVFRRYNEPDVAGKYEVDHLISLELGGSNNVTNLWPEPYTPTPGAHQKDTVENYLHAQVCKNAMTLAQAQQSIRSDWYAVYMRLAG
ncbi:MAG TPA: HNH endonuclease [Chloroflexota bacterium]|nr:HNH endonuclease [Chloroflexota bacterium]